MDLRQLQQFKDIVESNNITKAAESNFMTQSALTRSLQRLEAELGVQLFLRKGKTLLLTDAGRCVYRHACTVLEELAQMSTALTPYRDSTQPITCCTDATLFSKYLFPEFLSQPGAAPLQVTVCSGNEMEQDLLLTSSEPLCLITAKCFPRNPAIAQTLVFRDRPLLHVLSSSPLAQCDSIDCAALDGKEFAVAEMEPSTLEALKKSLADAGITCTFHSLSALGYYSYVLQNKNMLGFTSYSMQHFYRPPNRKVLQITGADIRVPFYAYYRSKYAQQLHALFAWLRAFNESSEQDLF